MATSVCQDSICVEAEESSSAPAVSTQDDEAMILPASSRLRMHRSAVRPFFCCGSELSLVSITDQDELPCQDKPTVSSSCPEPDLQTNGLSACAEVLLSSHSDEGSFPEGKSSRDRSLRKKSVEGFSRKMARKSWAVKLRGKLPKRLKNGEDHGNLAASGSGMEVSCTCTAYRQTDGQPVLYCYGAASSDNGPLPIPTTFGGLDTDQPTKSKGTKGKGRAKPKAHNGAGQTGVSASTMFKAWIGVDTSDAESVDDMSLVQCKEQGAVDKSRRVSLDSKNLLYSCNGGTLFTPAFQKQCTISGPWPQSVGAGVGESSVDASEEENQYSDVASLGPRAPYVSVHSQVDYVHCLVPDLACITNCSFYWGVMDRYEAEKLLENKPEGTFLLRDSAQDEFLFSVSFRRYGRSLHARVEQFNHKFSFDSHDPGVFATDTVCGLIEHYKDPSCCLFFEPMLTLPLNRSFPFSLQHLCRSIIVSANTYDGITQLPLPNSLQGYLRYYHYKHKVRVRSLETQCCW
ncbi:uncharacterized protein LOC135466718 [Liolophura sinensis]|uniref:uncharacterized protein LOC135466718 n=1 Tax=Liolophura sinensis TaxID=3198878 RepID=UPI003158BE61